MGKSWNQPGFASVLGNQTDESNWLETGYKSIKRNSKGFYWNNFESKPSKSIQNVRLVVTDLSTLSHSRGIEGNEVEVRYAERVVAVLPRALAQIAEAIEESKSILDLEDNWDDEGAERFHLQTWLRAIEFLTSYAIAALRDFGVLIEKPEITPGPDGSIDVLWKNSSYRLLFNIGKEENSSALFYGDNYKDQKIKGSINPKDVNAGMLCFLGRA